MKIEKGKKVVVRNGKAKTSIIDINYNDNYQIYVFQGKLSPYDIIIKYSEKGKRIRTPKHIHWVVDSLMKLQGNKVLMKKFLRIVQKNWENCKPLKSNDVEALTKIIEDSMQCFNGTHFKVLNKFGEYKYDFLFVLMHLLMYQEKTNREDAYMFGKILTSLLKEEIDIFSIVSIAGYNGR
ncbi:MAG: hypothetical protein HFH08_01735 [Bacilli bacterium]|nr:hypothetical protein [Bacilli bacterium]